MKRKTKTQNKKSVTSKLIEFPIIKITWKDHFSANHTWQTPDELRTNPMINVSVGCVVKEDKETITLASNMGENMLVADTITILKNCITKQVRLGEVCYDKKA